MSHYLGYGSLISPTVVAAYFFDDREEKTRQKYSKQFSDQESVLRSDFTEKWREIKDEVDMIPVKVRGLKRSYSLKSRRGGLMLSASEDEEEWINGVVIRGLPEKQQEVLDNVESDYVKHEISLEDIETYPNVDVEIEQEPILYLSDEVDKFDPGDREINRIYHRTILEGIDLLAEDYGQSFAEEFRDDFLKTTYLRGKPVSERYI
ncbi:MAG: hypothetical protein ABEK10_04585 [Candidatus Nanosalina sp.]